MDARIIKKIYLAFLCAIILLFVVQTATHTLPDSKLCGAEIPLKAPAVTISDIMSVAYQRNLDSYISSIIAFRGFFIKLDNQINFFLFHEISAKAADRVVLGKKNALFLENSIRSFNRLNVRPPEEFEQKIRDMKQLQDLLKARGIFFLFIMTPGKATVYPEYVPDNYITTNVRTKQSNYEIILPLLKKYNIQYYDGYEFCFKAKKKLGYTLFTKSGIHWSLLAGYYALQDVWKTIERNLGKNLMRMPDPAVYEEKKPKFPDDDLARLVNIFSVKDFYEPVYKYPVLTIDPEIKTRFRPKFLTVGDSFMRYMQYFMDELKLYRERDFFYYYRSHERYPEMTETAIPKDRGALKKMILSQDVVLLEVNEQNLPELGWDFFKDAVDALSRY